MATVTIEYCGVEGSGATVTKAKQNAASIIERFVRDASRDPVVIAAGPWTAIIWRTIHGWSSAIIAGPDRETGMYGSGSYPLSDSRYDVERSVRLHLADLATDWQSCYSADDVHPVCEKESDRKEIAYRAAFRRRYAAYRDRGFDDNQAHHLAGQFGHLVGLPQIPECDAA